MTLERISDGLYNAQLNNNTYHYAMFFLLDTMDTKDRGRAQLTVQFATMTTWGFPNKQVHISNNSFLR